jgi:magnesium-transporting ATPase (P-type)
VLRDPMLLLLDPVRPDVPDAIRECHGAGIRVVMLTGDYPATARSIARQIGLRNDDGCLSGPELVGMDDATIRRTIRSVDVFARIKPDQKLRLVRALRANGEVVAMTGDGVNDAPALKAADIGVAMGSRGTDVAREAAALVLLDRQAGLDDRDVRTLTFTTLIISNLMLILTNRSLARSLVFDRRSVNPALGWIVGTAVVALGVVLFVPAARDLFVLGRPHALDLAVCAAAGLMAITWMERLKFLIRDQVLDGALPP